MNKTKIILADTNEQYISSLEIKFITEISEYIDLEIITDKDYFARYFERPVQADILVVSDVLFSPELKKHNIARTFILSEQSVNSADDTSSVIALYKYSNTNDIYNRIVSVTGIADNYIRQAQETQIVMFYSAAGGVGKTTLSVAMCLSLSREYKRVLYINAQEMNTFNYLLNDKSCLPNSLLAEITSDSKNAYSKVCNYIRNEGFDYLPPFKAALSSCGATTDIYKDLIESIKNSKMYDVIVVDTDSTLDANKGALISMANKVIILTTQFANSISANNSLLKNINCSENNKYYFVCNMFRRDKINPFEDNATVAIKPEFKIADYINSIPSIETMNISGISEIPDVSKLTYLIK